jgi:DNA polymerase family A
MRDLPFREVWLCDTEFIAEPGNPPVPVCLVAKEWRSGRLVRLWQDELGARPPFPVDDDTLLVAFMAAAELGFFIALDWPVPRRVLDLYVAYRVEQKGVRPPLGYGLLSALAAHGLSSITKEEKQGMIALVQRGGPWSPSEREAVLNYCESDVDVLGPLLERMLPSLLATPKSLGQELLRGRYMTAVARMEHTGIPIDTVMLGRLRRQWHPIRRELIRRVDKDYGIFDETVFKVDRFESWLREQGIQWPRTDAGRLRLDRELFHEMGRSHPKVRDLATLRRDLAELRLEKLTVGEDGRNRAPLMPFAARSGRNAPPASKFVFGPSNWVRGLIKPQPGRGLAYIDWASQEIVVAAALSGDQALLQACASGDPYIAFARLANLAPADATKRSHKQVRDVCKVSLLATNYGQGARSLAQRLGTSLLEAERIQRAVAQTFPVFTQWAQHIIDVGELRGELSTLFGWRLQVAGDTRPTSMRNFPVQGNGAEILRIAAILTTERGIQVCAPVHDALLIEAAKDDLEEAIDTTRAAMSEAARLVLGGIDIATDVVTVMWPERYSDPRGLHMWQRVTELLQDETEQYEDTPAGWSYRPPIPKPLERSERKGSGERLGLVGRTRCIGCGQWIRKRPELDNWDEEERAYAGDEWQEHVCEADFGSALDLTSMEEWEAWEAFEREQHT